ncbi:MAG: DUF2490 domain-containing protein [Candidatus Sericytochromatia bacterium]
MIKPLVGALLAVLLSPAPALAAVQQWYQVENEVQLPKPVGWSPDAVSFATDVRYSSDRVGLERVQLRWGPRWNIGSWLELGINHNAYLQQDDSGVMIQEQRLELQPTFMGTVGPLAWEDRSRLERRMRPDSVRMRYRNQLRLAAEVAPGWTPFVADEVFFDLERMVFNENRVTLGLAHDRAEDGWEFSYTFRQEQGAGWAPDHLLALGWEAGVDLR